MNALMRWGVVTLTTVGYGDVYPMTGWGRFLGVIIAISAIGIFAMPAGILAGGFAEVMKETESRKAGQRCPHCGKDLATP